MNLQKLKAVLGAKKPGEQQPADANATAEATMSAEQEAALTAAIADAKAEGAKTGAKAERDRLAAIFASEKVKGKEVSALKLAGEAPDMSAEKVIEVVASLGSEAVKPAGAAPIETRMAGQGADLALGAPIKSAQQDTKTGWDKAIAKLPGNKSAA